MKNMTLIDLKLMGIKMMLKNKKGAEKIISVYWFAILFIVAGTIAFMVSSFYGDPYDVREVESGILINNIADCLTKEDGKLKETVSEKDFLDTCHLNFDTGDSEEQYYVKVEFYNFDKTNNLGSLRKDESIDKGNINWEISSGASSLKSIFKIEKSFYVLNNEGNERIVKITSMIGKEKKNV